MYQILYNRSIWDSWLQEKQLNDNTMDIEFPKQEHLGESFC